LRIAEIITADCANGEGTRLSIFVSGCNNNCKGCFNKEAQNFKYGIPYTDEVEDFIINELSKEYYHGLTILGGEPFEEVNQPWVMYLIKRVRRELPNKTIWVYTGYVYEDLMPYGKRYYGHMTDTILDNIDVLVDGPFIEEKKDISLKFRGSSNQRIIDVPMTRELSYLD
jgi:anaerobic ribonucleoside-triphosphate reductase activating protein